jgi:hypothetical protein
LNDQPIVARPATTRYQLQKFARRNKVLVAGAVTTLVVLAARTLVSTWQALRAGSAERVAVEERNRAVMERDRAEAAAAAERQAREREIEQRQAAESARADAEHQKTVAQHALTAADINLYFNNIDLADREWASGNISHADRLLEDTPKALRNWERQARTSPSRHGTQRHCRTFPPPGSQGSANSFKSRSLPPADTPIFGARPLTGQRRELFGISIKTPRFLSSQRLGRRRTTTRSR